MTNKKNPKRRSTKRRSLVADIEGDTAEAKNPPTTRKMTDEERARHFPHPTPWLDRKEKER